MLTFNRKREGPPFQRTRKGGESISSGCSLFGCKAQHISSLEDFCYLSESEKMCEKHRKSFQKTVREEESWEARETALSGTELPDETRD